jgi:hypothetical protein
VREPAPIEVRVHKSGAVVLVLDSQSPAIWRVSPDTDTRIVSVLLTGYHTSRVEGIPSDTLMIDVAVQSRKNGFVWTRECAPFDDYVGDPYLGGPAAMVFDRQVHALTGRNLDSLRGAYSLQDVDIR